MPRRAVIAAALLALLAFGVTVNVPHAHVGHQRRSATTSAHEASKHPASLLRWRPSLVAATRQDRAVAERASRRARRRVPAPAAAVTRRPAPPTAIPVRHQPRPVPRPRSNSRPVQRAIPAVWRALVQCEAGGDWRYGGPGGHTDPGYGSYEGGPNFLPSTWLAYGGAEFAGHAYDATPAEQVTVARRVLAAEGVGAWPVCSRRVGLQPGD